MAVELKFLVPRPSNGLILRMAPPHSKKYLNTSVMIVLGSSFIGHPPFRAECAMVAPMVVVTEVG